MITDIAQRLNTNHNVQSLMFKAQCSKEKSFLLRNSQEYCIFAKNNSLPNISELIDILEG